MVCQMNQMMLGAYSNWGKPQWSKCACHGKAHVYGQPGFLQLGFVWFIRHAITILLILDWLSQPLVFPGNPCARSWHLPRRGNIKGGLSLEVNSWWMQQSSAGGKVKRSPRPRSLSYKPRRNKQNLTRLQILSGAPLCDTIRVDDGIYWSLIPC